MKLLICGFEGDKNSAKLLLDYLNGFERLYLANDRIKSVSQLEDKLSCTDYDYVFLIGQKPLLKNRVCIEQSACRNNQRITTGFDYKDAEKRFAGLSLGTRLSENAGTSFCSHIYFYALECG